MTSVDEGSLDQVLTPVGELGADEIVLLGANATVRSDLAQAVEPLGVEVEHHRIDQASIVGVVRVVQRIVEARKERREQILVNPAPASRHLAMGLFVRALAANVRVIEPVPGAIRRFPRLWFGYDVLVGDEELEILEAISRSPHHAATLYELAERTGLHPSQVSYRIRGGDLVEGLIPQGLVSISQAPAGERRISLTPSGSRFVGGAGATAPSSNATR